MKRAFGSAGEPTLGECGRQVLRRRLAPTRGFEPTVAQQIAHRDTNRIGGRQRRARTRQGELRDLRGGRNVLEDVWQPADEQTRVEERMWVDRDGEHHTYMDGTRRTARVVGCVTLTT